MTYTRHGHHIPGSPYADEEGVYPQVARCGGPTLCAQCAKDSGLFAGKTDRLVEEKELFEDTSEYDKDPDRYLKAAKQFVMGNYNSTHEIPDQLTEDQLYITWFAKVLDNWKAMISTTVAGDRLYFEVTHNGEKLEAYVDTYRKEDNQVFSRHTH